MLDVNLLRRLAKANFGSTLAPRVKDPLIKKATSRWFAKSRRKLLVDLANLMNHPACEWFWRRHPIYLRQEASSENLMVLRDQLRAVWDSDPQAGGYLQLWVEWEPPEGSGIIIPKFAVESSHKIVMPNPGSLHIQLALAVAEHAARLGHCQNPDCLAPYFLRYRDRRQQFCGNTACLRYGEKLHKRRWWAKHGKTWRKARRASTKKSQRKRGK